MAVENYNPILLPNGSCLDQDFFQPAYQSLATLDQAAKDGAGTFECVHFSGNISGSANNGEACVQAIAPGDMPKEYSSGDQICCVMVSYRGFMQSPVFLNNSGSVFGTVVQGAYFNSQGINATLRCSGQTFASSEAQGNGVFTAILDPKSCDFSQGLVLCADATSDYPGDELEYQLNWCGCIICVQCPPLPLENYYVPRQPPRPECEYGLGDLALVIHALNQLNAAFRCAGYTVECVTKKGLTTPTPIAEDLDSDTKWVGIACTTVNWAAIRQFYHVKVESTMGCASRPVSCNPGSYYTRAPSFNGSAEFASFGCGECGKGESIWFGAAPEYQCAQSDVDEEAPNPTDVEIDGISDAIFWIFRKVENDLPNLPQLSSGCVFEDTAEAVTLGAEAIYQAACNVQKLQKIPRTFAGAVMTGEQFVIVEPNNDPNLPVPIPEKKWAIYGTFQPVAVAIAPPDKLSLGGKYQYEIKCGGAVIHTSPLYDWITLYEGIPNLSGDRMPICAIVDCPIDQPIEICGTSFLVGLAAEFAIEFEGMALCITQA